MDSIGTENISARLTLSELVIKQISQQIVNEQILYNYKYYLVIFSILFLASSISNWLAAYVRKRGENFATKADFENLLNQIKAQTKTTEEVKAAINHKDWMSKEWKTLRRIKLAGC